MGEIVLPSSPGQALQLEVNEENPYMVLGTSPGLKKETNEDSVGSTREEDKVRICIADGHWGADAARASTVFWLDTSVTFPRSKVGAQRRTEELEQKLFHSFGHDAMNEDEDRTPETSFIALEIEQDTLRIVSYGDCRMLIVRNGRKLFSPVTHATWLGAFSHLRLRGRSPASQGTLFHRKKIKPGDCVLLYTDGLDECIYEQPTLSLKTIIEATHSDRPSTILQTLIKKAFEMGAEDNVSIAVWTNKEPQ